MPSLIGNKPNQVPTNGDLGTMAFREQEQFYDKGQADALLAEKVNKAGDTMTGGLTLGGALNLGSTGQIEFPATQNASSNANTLDDYEEGTWTPSVGGTATYIIQNGTYVKVGRMVTVMAKMQISSIGTGTTATVSGLPFVADNSTNAQTCHGPVGYFGSLSQNVVELNISPNNNSTVLTLLGLNVAASTAVSGITVLQSGSRIDFSVTYITNV